MGLLVEKHEDLSAALRSELASLYRGLPPEDANIFNHPGFLGVAWEHYAQRPDAGLTLYVARDEARNMVGAACFRRDGISLMGLRFNALVPLTYRFSDFSSFLVDRRRHAEFLNAALASGPMRKENCFIPFMAEAAYGRPQRPFVRTGLSTNHVARDDDGFFEALLKKKKLKYYNNRLAKLGALSVTHHYDDCRPEHFHEYIELHRERWRFDNIASKYERPEFRELYRKLLYDFNSHADGPEKVLVTRIALNGTTIAFGFSYIWRDNILYHVPAINIAYWKYSPGQVLIRALIEYARDNNIRNVDFGHGEEGYKASFTNAAIVYGNYFAAAHRWHHSILKCLIAARDWPISRAVVARTPRSLFGLPRKILAKIRTPGVSIRELSGRMSRTMKFYASPSPADAASDGAELVELDVSDYIEFARRAEVTELPYQVSRKLQNRFGHGARLYALHRAGELVSFAWAIEAQKISVGEIAVTIDFGEPWLYIYDCVTPEKHRGKGYYPRLLTTLQRSHSGQASLICASADNQASINGILKAGYREFFSIRRRLGKYAVRRSEPAEDFMRGKVPLPADLTGF